MTFLKNRGWLVLVIISFVLLFTACSDNNKNDNKQNDKANANDNQTEVNKDNNENNEVAKVETFTEPITLKISVGASDEAFEEIYKGPAEEQFPNLTLEQVPFAPNKDTIEEQLMAGNVPDIIFGGSPVQLKIYEEYDLLTDHTELINAHQFDIDMYDQGFIELIRSHSPTNELYGIPIDMTRYALHYNKDIFDMFGVAYPEDGMTWDDVLELSKLVSGEMDGKKYDGVQLTVFDTMLSTISAPLVDPETDEPLFTTSPELAALFNLYDDVYTQNGPEPDLSAVGQFIGDQTLAMLPIYYLNSGWTGLREATDSGMNWDIVTYPVWDANDPRTGMAGGRWLGVTAYSDHPNEAFEVLAFVLDRDRLGLISESPLTAPYQPDEAQAYINEVGLDKYSEGVNIEALFKNPTLTDRPKLSKYQYDLYPLLVDSVNDFINPPSGTRPDVNTALRKIQESAVLVIEDVKANE